MVEILRNLVDIKNRIEKFARCVFDQGSGISAMPSLMILLPEDCPGICGGIFQKKLSALKNKSVQGENAAYVLETKGGTHDIFVNFAWYVCIVHVFPAYHAEKRCWKCL